MVLFGDIGIDFGWGFDVFYRRGADYVFLEVS